MRSRSLSSASLSLSSPLSAPIPCVCKPDCCPLPPLIFVFFSSIFFDLAVTEEDLHMFRTYVASTVKKAAPNTAAKTVASTTAKKATATAAKHSIATGELTRASSLLFASLSTAAHGVMLCFVR